VHIGELAIAARLPTISPDRQFADAGVLMSYGVNEVLFWRQAATFIDRILKGAKPGELAIEESRKLDLVINLEKFDQSLPVALMIFSAEALEQGPTRTLETHACASVD
jgi:ABC-type uncharacterized transport system substrate-binding protein